MNQYVNKSLYSVIYKDRINELLASKKHLVSALNELIEIMQNNTDPEKHVHFQVQLTNYEFSLISVDRQLEHWNQQLERLN